MTYIPTVTELEEIGLKFEQWKRIEWLIKVEEHYKKELNYDCNIIYSVPNNQFWLSDFENNIKI